MKKYSDQSIHQRAQTYARVAATTALVAGMMASAYQAYGHGGDDPAHDLLLETIPGGVSTLRPDLHKDPVVDGEVGPVLPMHTMSVHNTLTWKKDKKMPFMLMFHRHSAYTAEEVANPDIIDFLIKNKNPSTGVNAFGSPTNQFNSSMRRSFQQFAYGGYNIIHDVSQSVPTRIGNDQTRELTQLWDMNHPKAFQFDRQSPPYASAALDNTDALRNADAFYNRGNSRGLFYDMYCPGFSTLEDGRPVFMGGHDLNSQNGNYRTQIFDPELEKWAERPESCMRKMFGKAPEAVAFRIANIVPKTDANGVVLDTYETDWNLERYYKDQMDAYIAAHPGTTSAPNTYTSAEVRTYMQQVFVKYQDGSSCDPHKLAPDSYSPTYNQIRLAGLDGTVTSPGKVGSDMKYARWYPGQISLPGNKIFVYAGWDRDESKYPSLPVTGTTVQAPNSTTMALDPFLAKASNYPDLKPEFVLSGYMKSGGDTDFANTTVKQVVSEVYDGNTDSMVAMENAPLFHNAWYPNGLVVQSGATRNDWKVAVNDASYIGPVVSSKTGSTRVDANGNTLKIGAYKPDATVLNRQFHNSFLFDIQAALKDMAVKGSAYNGDPALLDPILKADGTVDDAAEAARNPYWTKLSEGISSHSEFTGNANIIELDKLGNVVSHKLMHVGGQYPVQSTTLAKAAVVGDTTLTFGAPTTGEPMHVLGSFILGPTTNREAITVVGYNSAAAEDGTVSYTATLAAALTKAQASGAALSIATTTSKNVEEIDFTNLSKKVKKGQPPLPSPQWKVVGELYQPGRQNYCTPLPDGTVMILGGNGGTLGGIENWSLHTQLYNPALASSYDPATVATSNSVRMMAKTLIPRDEHGIIQLMPDATVYLGGQNRNGLVVAGDAIAPLGDPDLGVPNGQMFRPPYLFDTKGDPAPRPSISQAPALIDYGRPFKLKTFSMKPITKVSLVRSGAMSHSLNTDVRLVKVAFKQGKNGVITVYPPKLPGTAVGGYYQMYVVDEAGVPSEGVKVALGTAITKRVGKPASKFALTAATPTTTEQ